MSRLQNRYWNKPAAVLGGGPSLPGDMERLPGITWKEVKEAGTAKTHRFAMPTNGMILIAVNYHALLFCKPTFIVYNDPPESDPELFKAIQDKRLIKVSSDPTSDIKFDVPVWTGFYSSNTAAWFALWMGCNPVILCGMDCYQGEEKYCHPYKIDQPSFHYPLDDHLQPWIEEGRQLLPNVERLKVMSGPLINIFGRYEVKSEEILV